MRMKEKNEVTRVMSILPKPGLRMTWGDTEEKKGKRSQERPTVGTSSSLINFPKERFG